MFYYRGAQLYAVRHGPFKAHFITKPAYGAGAAVKHDPPLLYHLGHDPSEKHDVAARHPEALEAIGREVARHLEKLVKGPDRLAARITNK
jgi:arylsulfatase A-like enzyme